MITYIKSNSVIKGDTAIGITFSSFLALGVILIGVAIVQRICSISYLEIFWRSKMLTK
ncbi:manganese transport system membrane protein [Listeria aquatica FSL S10-1188]|uniref:Manganese transport system membrane protein n=1 Tax=Listeria aquatica FSL S10-1188 TaxID=1265818 RepID=W7AUG0_9LIST|nr:manganese transport system membrane protein [Listeria aquatica FSL S10-1188]